MSDVEAVASRAFHDPASRRQKGLTHDSLRPLFMLSDACIVVSASVIGNAVYQRIISGDSDLGTYAGLGLFSGVGYLLAAHYFQLYQSREFVRPRVEFERIFVAWAFMIFLLSAFFFLMKFGSQVSRGSIICFVVIALPSLVVWRRWAKRIIRNEVRAGTIRGRRALLIGTADELLSITRHHLLTQYGVEEAERIILPSQRCAKQEGAAHAAVYLARSMDADELIVALPWGDTRLLEIVRGKFKALPLRVRLLPDRFTRSLMGRRSEQQLQLIDIIRAPLSRTDRLLKRCIDVVVAVATILILLPLLAVVALAVRFDGPGPVIFRQRRRGFNGQEFVIYKFRTMRVAEDGLRIIQATRGDPRVTKLGELLRRSSIDELPQLFNVLRGEMSLVGPRPHALAHDDEYGAQISDYAFRHHVKPGITGLAQVAGLRGETKQLDQMKRRIDLDIKYVDNWSLWLDLQILGRTFFAVISSPNAY
jgi:Undecaprenyl-phosphate glucose phosphotransferase